MGEVDDNDLPSHLAPILGAWCQVMTRYGEVWRWRDVPYWYNERASCGNLAAAIWLCGSIALEEYRTDKGDEGGVSAPARRKGRGDLHFHFQGSHFIIEAKHYWAYPGRGKRRTVADATAQLSSACDDVRHKRAYLDPTGIPQRRLAVVFAVPSFPATAQ